MFVRKRERETERKKREKGREREPGADVVGRGPPASIKILNREMTFQL